MLSIGLNPELEARLNELAEATGRSKSFYVRQALEEFLRDRAEYLLAERFAPELPLALGGSMAILAGLLMAAMNHLALNRRPGTREGNMTFQYWNHLILVFAVTMGAMLSVGQLVITRHLPEPRTGHHVISIALYLLMLGLTAYSQGVRPRSRQDEPSPGRML